MKPFRSARRPAAATARVALCLTLAGHAIAAPDPPAGESTEDRLPPLFRATDLPRGHFFTGGNHGASEENGGHARDWKARRLNANGKWVASYDDVADNPHCANDERDCDVYGESIIFRVPLYAPADGEVVSCWRNLPNNPAPGTSHPRRCCQELIDEDGKCVIGSCSDDECFEHSAPEIPVCPVRKSGNYVLLLTDDGHYVFAGHLTPGSIPERLCPFADEFMTNANVKACGGGECSDVPAETLISPAERPRVRRGDLIGRVGNSGGTTSPHVHTHQGRMRINDAGIPMKQGGHRPWLLGDAWMRPSEAPDWTALDGWELKKTEDNPQPLIEASPFHRTDTALAGSIEAVSLAGNVTAVINGSQTLEVTAWEVSDDGLVKKKGSAQGVGGDLVASTRITSGPDIVTAVRDSSGDLRIDSWSVSSAGDVQHADHTSAGPIGDVAATRFPTGRGAIVAVEAGNGNLKLITWSVDDDGVLDRTGSVEGGAARSVAITGIRKGRRAGQDPDVPFLGVATAVETGDGKLRVETWAWSETAQTLGAAGSVEGADILGHVAIAAVSLPDDRQMLVTAVRTASGLLLQSWSVGAAGDLENRWSHREGNGRHIDIDALSESRFVTSFEDGQGDLRLRAWSLGPKGKLGRLGDAGAGAVSGVAASRLRRDGGDTRLVLTAVRDGQERLRLIVFDTAL